MSTIAEAMRDALKDVGQERGQDPHDIYVWQGDPNLLHDAYGRASTTPYHHPCCPLAELNSVMGALSRSDLFERVGTIKACSRTGVQREVPYVAYKLRRQAEQADTTEEDES